MNTLNRLVCLRLVYAQSLQKPAKRLPVQLTRFLFIARPLETTAVLDAFVQQYKRIPFPQQCLDALPAAATKQEQVVGIGVQLELPLDQLGKALYTTAQVGVAAGQIDVFDLRNVSQHGAPSE